MYFKGRSFILAAGLLKAYDGEKFVYLHLLCQGFECIGKAILLNFNYEEYFDELRNYGHDLDRLWNELNKIVNGQCLLSNKAKSELTILSKFYKKHQLRYGDALDYEISTNELNADTFHTELISLLQKYNVQFQ